MIGCHDYKSQSILVKAGLLHGKNICGCGSPVVRPIAVDYKVITVSSSGINKFPVK